MVADKVISEQHVDNLILEAKLAHEKTAVKAEKSEFHTAIRLLILAFLAFVGYVTPDQDSVQQTITLNSYVQNLGTVSLILITMYVVFWSIRTIVNYGHTR